MCKRSIYTFLKWKREGFSFVHNVFCWTSCMVVEQVAWLLDQLNGLLGQFHGWGWGRVCAQCLLWDQLQAFRYKGPEEKYAFHMFPELAWLLHHLK